MQRTLMKNPYPPELLREINDAAGAAALNCALLVYERFHSRLAELRDPEARRHALPDMIGFARIDVIRAWWPGLRARLSAGADVRFERRCPPMRLYPSIILSGWRRVMESAPEIDRFVGASQLVTVQHAAHEAAAEVLRRYGVVCRAEADLD